MCPFAGKEAKVQASWVTFLRFKVYFRLFNSKAFQKAVIFLYSLPPLLLLKKSLLSFILFSMDIVMTCMSVYHMYAWDLWKLGENIESPGTGVTNDREP